MDKEIKNYYEILEVPINSSLDAIHEGYIRAKNAYSGDSVALYSLLTTEECSQILDQIETAYSVLSIPGKRREYDRIKGLNLEGTVLYEGNSLSSSSSFNTSSGSSEKQLHNQPSSGDDPYYTNFERPTQTPVQQWGGAGPSPAARQSSHYSEEDFSINFNEAQVSKISAQRRFQLSYQKDPAMEEKIENATTFSGSLLKEIRDYKQISLEKMSDLTKISKTYIRYIEEENIENLPAMAYVRGFVYQYAKTLKLNPELVATSYTHHIKSIK